LPLGWFCGLQNVICGSVVPPIETSLFPFQQFVPFLPSVVSPTGTLLAGWAFLLLEIYLPVGLETTLSGDYMTCGGS
jgi:hypothetical protein